MKDRSTRDFTQDLIDFQASNAWKVYKPLCLGILNGNPKCKHKTQEQRLEEVFRMAYKMGIMEQKQILDCLKWPEEEKDETD